MDGSVTFITQKKLKKGCSNCGAKKRHIISLESFNPTYETNPRYRTYQCDKCGELYKLIKPTWRKRKAKQERKYREMKKEQNREIKRNMNRK
jgi:hypothetical protein